MAEQIGRYLIRFAIPGGYAVLIGLFEEAVFGWAWAQSVEEVVSATPADAISTFGGAVIIGFLIFCVYLGVAWLRPSWHTNLGALALEALADIPGVERAIVRAYRLSYGLGALPEDMDAKRRTQIHSERMEAVHCLLDLTPGTGDEQLLKSYNGLLGWYHVFGACRTAIVMISTATAVDIVVKHHHAYLAHLDRSLLVTATSLALGYASWRLFTTLRRQVSNSMTRRLANNLRAWTLRHPEILIDLASPPAAELSLNQDAQVRRRLPVRVRRTTPH